MIDPLSVAIGASIGFILSFIISTILVFASAEVQTERLKEENERLNSALSKLTARDSRGRFIKRKK